MTAFGLGGVKAGSIEAFEYLASSFIGKIVLALTAIGLLIYLTWTFYVAIKDPEDMGTDRKGLITRFNYIMTGLFYGLLGFTAAKMIVFPWSETDNGKLYAPLLNSSLGVVFLYTMCVVFVIKAGYQIHLVTSNGFKNKVETSDIEGEKRKHFFLKAGQIGYISRSVVFAVIAYLSFEAAFNANPDSVDNTKDALDFLEDTFGTVILAVIAFGTLAFGLFVLLKAKYRQISLD